MAFEKTEALRKSLSALGIGYRRGYHIGHMEDGCFHYEKAVNEDSVTSAFPVRGADGMSITFEEDDDGYLNVVDDITPEQALAIVLAASSERWQ